MAQSVAPPPKGGNGAFIAAALAMLLLMGGLIFWKMRGDSGPTQPTATAPPPATTPPVFEQPPPPPPPPPPPEPDAGKKPTTRVMGGGGGGCAGECKGTATAALQSALAGKAGAARGCYERGLRQNAMLQGRLVVAVRVGPAGQVCSASVASNALGDPGVASCVVGLFRSSSFPAPTGGCVDTQVPMNFVPKGGGK
jgi:outer membrane biosynthesis protein TonB